jgi:hypothetical protein
VSRTPAINCLAVPMSPLKNVSPVSKTPAINLYHGFSVIGGSRLSPRIFKKI